MTDLADPIVFSARDLRVEIAGREIVRGVDLDVRAGEMLALVGESGCGKSVTAFSIMQLLPDTARIQAARLALGDRALLDLRPSELRSIRGNEISIVLQEPMSSLNPVLTIGFQVAEVLKCHRRLSPADLRAEVVDLLGLVGIPEPQRRYHDYPHMFSGGMRQRVMIAIAIACRPKLLIADEPTTALDVTIQAQIMDLIDDLRQKLSMAVVLITHDLHVVSRWADRVAVMYAGRIVEEASADTFASAPQHPYSKGLLGSTIINNQHYRNGKLVEIAGSVNGADEQRGCSFFPRCPIGDASCTEAPPRLRRSGSSAVACYKVDLP